MKIPLLFLGICFLFSACCTKKDCDLEYNPEIIFRFDGFNSSDLTKVSIVLEDIHSSKLIDSVVYLYSISNTFKIYNWMLLDKEIEIKDYNYIIRTDVSVDTINQIMYEKYNEKIECNTCYPFGDGTATVINYKNFSYYNKEIKYVDKDTVVIRM